MSFFGEMSLLDPWEGQHPGTVVADTYVELLVINKKQIDVTKYGPEFIKVGTAFHALQLCGLSCCGILAAQSSSVWPWSRRSA